MENALRVLAAAAARDLDGDGTVRVKTQLELTMAQYWLVSSGRNWQPRFELTHAACTVTVLGSQMPGKRKSNCHLLSCSARAFALGQLCLTLPPGTVYWGIPTLLDAGVVATAKTHSLDRRRSVDP